MAGSLAGVLALALAAGSAPGPSCPAGPDGGCAMAEAKVTLKGVAQDAKGGAVLVADDGRVLYLDGLDAWPGPVRGKRVEVTGSLAEEKRIPDPGTHPRTAGAYGTQTVLYHPAWRVLE